MPAPYVQALCKVDVVVTMGDFVLALNEMNA
jgi:hypothetical protein